MFIRRLLVLVLVFASAILIAQERQVMLPTTFDSKLLDSEDLKDVSFYYYKFQSPKVDIRHFKTLYPTLQVPDYIDIKMPTLGTFQDTVVLMGVIGDAVNENDLIIWLAGDYETNKVTFYVDRTLDRRFDNDGPPLIIKASQGPVKVIIKPIGKASRKELYLAVAKKDESTFRKVLGLKNWKEKIQKQFSIELYAGMGVGDISYNYNNTETGFPAWYDVSLSSKNLGAFINYEFPKIKIGLGVQYMNMFYYTSYTNVRFDEPEIAFTSMGQVTIDNVRVDRNLEIQPSNIFQYSLLGAYKIKVNKYAEIQPTIIAGVTQFSPQEFVPDRRESEIGYPMKNNRFFDLGIRAEFTVAKRKAIFFGFSFNKIFWEADGFKESLPQQNFQSQYQTYKGLFGYRFAI